MKLNFRLASVIGLASVLTMMLSNPAAATTSVTHSNNFAGYSSTSSIAVTSFTGSLSVPSITCPATGSPHVSATLNLNGDPAYDLIFGWQAQCTNGSLILDGVSAIFCPTAGQFCNPSAGVSAAPGDSIQLSMSENRKTSTTTVKLTNSTQKQTASASVRSLLSEPSIGAGTGICSATCQGNTTPIPSFNPIKFGNLKFNGLTLSSFSPTRIEMFDGTTLQVATSSVSSTGTFTTTFKHV